MKHLAEPVLYSRLRITENTHEHLSRLLAVDEAAIEHAEGGSVIRLQPLPLGTLTQKARFVQSLTISQLDYMSETKVVLEVASILHAVWSTLSHLFIDLSESNYWYIWRVLRYQILKAAFSELSNIEEYSLAPDTGTFILEPSPMASFLRIKRLMTLGVSLSYFTDIIKSLPNLQVLIAMHPDTRTLEQDLLRFLRATGGLKSIVVVLDTEPATDQLDTEHLSALMQKSAFRGGGSVFKMTPEEALESIQEGEMWRHFE
ncbi:hypothetical protein FRB94_003951 [Tulasnella sp. JGI-2019a]|nr:hypothetical protein FRB94_003951 [Tulasnella sp. JGI-2019a]KAG9008203.1 hypothetical protein FRB93_006771 [Tulasnella sp. JGI-2019a]